MNSLALNVCAEQEHTICLHEPMGIASARSMKYIHKKRSGARSGQLGGHTSFWEFCLGGRGARGLVSVNGGHEGRTDQLMLSRRGGKKTARRKDGPKRREREREQESKTDSKNERKKEINLISRNYGNQIKYE